MTKYHSARISRDLQDALARNVRHWRKHRGMTQAVLAYEADLTENTVTKVELGRADPHLSTVESLAAVLRIGLADLITLELPDGGQHGED